MDNLDFNSETHKRCTQCKEVRLLSAFTKRKDRLTKVYSKCKKCKSENAKVYYSNNKNACQERCREWRNNNEEAIRKYSKKYYDEHVAELNEKGRKYRVENPDKMKKYQLVYAPTAIIKAKNYRAENKDKIKQYTKEYGIKNRIKKNIYLRKWREDNPEKAKEQYRTANRKRLSINKYKISSNVSREMRSSLLKGTKLNRHWETLVNFNTDQLITHLESQFNPDMTWDNYGSHWEIDHKVPVAAFNFETPEDIDFKRCWSLDNLQPLEKFKNRKKSDKVDIPFQPSLAIAV